MKQDFLRGRKKKTCQRGNQRRTAHPTGSSSTHVDTGPVTLYDKEKKIYTGSSYPRVHFPRTRRTITSYASTTCYVPRLFSSEGTLHASNKPLLFNIGIGSQHRMQEEKEEKKKGSRISEYSSLAQRRNILQTSSHGRSRNPEGGRGLSSLAKSTTLNRS